MDIRKEGSTGALHAAQELPMVNAFAKKELTEEEVYLFAVKLCDNEIDRDGERFPKKTLEELAGLFVGKSGIFDHEWSAAGQTARIYRTEVVEDEGQTRAGDRCCYLKGYAYMLRSEKNAALIEEIEGGIKKEVSVGCSVRESVCSVCGRDISLCEHEKGRTYGGKLCFAELTDAIDAYEWSFVAVPAQKNAGVMKRCERFGEGTLKALVSKRGSRANLRELEELEKSAALGRNYLASLRREVVRLLLTAEESLSGETAEKMTEKLEEQALKELERVYRAKSAEKLGLTTQLSYGAAEKRAADENDFRV